MIPADKKGKCVIFSAPSGAGKTTLAHILIKDLGNLEFSISACSRMPRANEQNGVDYFFLTIDEFKQKIAQNEFLEWQEVYTNNFYGTLNEEVKRIWKNNKAVVFDVDVKGGLNIKKILGDQALAIFVAPPSIEELEKRLRNRSTETEEKIQIRMDRVRYEMTFADQFDVVLVNDVLENAVEKAEDIVRTFLEK